MAGKHQNSCQIYNVIITDHLLKPLFLLQNNGMVILVNGDIYKVILVSDFHCLIKRSFYSQVENLIQIQ